jgi:hypothetical protein
MRTGTTADQGKCQSPASADQGQGKCQSPVSGDQGQGKFGGQRVGLPRSQRAVERLGLPADLVEALLCRGAP